jgi:hypothetical protein
MSVYLLRGPSRARMDYPDRRRPETKRQARPSRSLSGLQAQARVEA